jgi:hypothetical protein
MSIHDMLYEDKIESHPSSPLMESVAKWFALNPPSEMRSIIRTPLKALFSQRKMIWKRQSLPGIPVF